jgi:hypothetical protein
MKVARHRGSHYAHWNPGQARGAPRGNSDQSFTVISNRHSLILDVSFYTDGPAQKRTPKVRWGRSRKGERGDIRSFINEYDP